MCIVTHLERGTAKKTMKDDQRSHGQPPEIPKCLTSKFLFPQSADDKNLQVDLLCVRRLGGKSSIGSLLEGEREDGGDPGVARGTHLEFKLNV